MLKIFEFIKSKAEMIKDFLKKKGWYLFVLVAFSVCLLLNISRIQRLDDASPISVFFFVWIFLILLPFFTEFEFLGIKIKKEVKEAVEKSNEEVKNSINYLRFLISQTNNVSSNINVSLDSSFYSAKKVRDCVKELEKKAPQIKTNEKPNVESSVLELFKVKFCLERELREIIKSIGCDDYRIMPTDQMIVFLLNRGLVQDKFYALLSAVIKIADRGIHGDYLRQEQVSLIVQAYPLIIGMLRDCKEAYQEED